MPRRRFRSLSRGRGKGPVSWVTAVSNGVDMPQAGVLLELALLEPADWAGEIVNTNKKGHLLRTIGHFKVCMTLEQAADAQEDWALFWAVYIIDSDDADASITTAAVGTILQGCRVLQTGVEAMSIRELPSAQVGTTWMPALSIDWDTRLRAKLQGDEVMVLGLQFGATVVGTAVTADVYGYGRTLIREP